MEKVLIPKGQEPVAPCESCLADPTRTLGQEGVLIWTYCPCRQAGSVRFWYRGVPWPWRTYSPQTYGQFLITLNEINASFEALKRREQEQDKQMENILATIPDDKLSKV